MSSTVMTVTAMCKCTWFISARGQIRWASMCKCKVMLHSYEPYHDVRVHVRKAHLAYKAHDKREDQVH